MVEPLEGRALLSAGVSRSFLATPIPEGAPLAEHIHVHLTIVVGGQPQIIPAGIGLRPGGALPLHTHNASGTIHVESTRRLPFRLGDFFAIWGQPFGRRDVLGHIATRSHPIRMTVNGRPSSSFGSLLLKDGQDVVVTL